MNPTTRIKDSALGLYQDRRGAIVMMAVFMASFLVGGLWYIIGIGDAILYRQRMQDGADAVVFAAAVYHARGMNIIAMINIIMAAILGVLVACKLLQLMNWIAMAISCALAWTGIGAAICSFTSALESPISSAVQAAEKMVKAVLPVLSKTQMGIAIAMPWVAEAKAVSIASKEYKKPVNAGGIISISLIPFVPKERLGLPVQEDDYKFLCKKAGQFVGNFVFSPFGSFGNWVGGVIGNLVSSFPSYFCAGSGGGGGGGGNSGGGGFKGGVGSDTMDSLGKQACQEKYDKMSNKDKKKFDMDDCVKDTKKDMQKSMDEKNKSSSSSSMDTNSMTSKRVFDKAENGNNYFQIWSIVVGDDEWPKKADKGVQIAAWNKGVVKPPMPWGKVGFAQAEFYYDTSTAWSKVKEDAMWNMRWRARLRRVRPLGADTGSWLSGGVLGKLGGAVSSALSGADVLGSILGSGGGIGGDLGNLLTGGAAWAEDAESDLMQVVDGFTIIH